MKRFIALFLLLLISCAPTPSGLAKFSKARGFDFGTAVAVGPLAESKDYQNLLAREYNLVTAENAMKFDATEPQRGVFDFSGGDQIVAFAQKHGMRVRGHNLIWHEALPDWVSNGDFSRDELIEIMQNHIRTVMGHYKGKVYAWDVVNEVMNDGTSTWRLGIGMDYVLIAYQTAREADPDALLFINEYGGEGMNGKSGAIYDLAKLLKERGLVDGVGMQMHITAPPDFTQEELEENMRRLGELGLVVHITELDVRLPTPATAQDLETQAEVYRQVVSACAAVEACEAVVTWGLTDGHSWVPMQYPNQGAALPFDENFQPKPAYGAMLETLQE